MPERTRGRIAGVSRDIYYFVPWTFWSDGVFDEDGARLPMRRTR
ncbi:hypothetical protein [Roseobacter fucihabitans]